MTAGSDGGSSGACRGADAGQQSPRWHDEVVEFGRPPRRRAPGWLSRLLLAALVAAALVLVLHRPGTHHATSRPAPPPVSITTVGHPILGVRSGWTLFGLTASNDVLSVRFDRGQITRTVLPPAEGNWPISFIVWPREVIVRPLDNVPGYLIPDGLPPRPLTGLLASGGLLLPGPAPDRVWFVDGVHPVTLVGPAGEGTGLSIAAAAQRWPAESAMADGRGEVLLFNDAGVLYDTGPGMLRRIGMLLAAIGPRNWLGISCVRADCHNVVIDVSTGAQRVLPGPALQVIDWPWPTQRGVISPDGSYAAVAVARGGTNVVLALIDLRTGGVSTVPVAIDPASSRRTLAWSPDSRWLFVITATGGLVAVSPGNDAVRRLGVSLPSLSEIAIRGAP